MGSNIMLEGEEHNSTALSTSVAILTKGHAATVSLVATLMVQDNLLWLTKIYRIQESCTGSP